LSREDVDDASKVHGPVVVLYLYLLKAPGVAQLSNNARYKEVSVLKFFGTVQSYDRRSIS
jgi:hypothetical protein